VRQTKDFATADAIRRELDDKGIMLDDKGIMLDDTPKGTIWRVKG